MHHHYDLARAIQRSRLEDAERARIARAARKRQRGQPEPDLTPPTLAPVPGAERDTKVPVPISLSEDGWQEAFADLEERFRESA